MTWSATLGIAAANALLTGAATLFAAEAGTRWHRVSSFEGGRGLLVMLGFVPLGLIVGGAIGAIVGRAGDIPGTIGFFRQLGVAALITCSLVGLGSVLAWISAPRR